MGPDGTRAALGRLPEMIDQDVLTRVLGTAVKSGADFAEVFAEDKRSTSAGLDDGRIEQVTSGRDRGAGIRVVKGDTTGFAHTADLSEAGLLAAAVSAAAAASQGGGWVAYQVINRQTQAITPKESYILPCGPDLAIGCGIYRNQDSGPAFGSGLQRAAAWSTRDERPAEAVSA